MLPQIADGAAKANRLPTRAADLIFFQTRSVAVNVHHHIIVAAAQPCAAVLAVRQYAPGCESR
jgi:hypothetical protein